MGAAGALPSAQGLMGGMSGGTAATTAAPGTSSTSAGISASNLLGGAVQTAIQKGIAGGAGALGSALGLDDSGPGGGESGGNFGGPKGDVEGVDETDRTKGPGHTIYKVAGNYNEKVGSIKALLALNGINTNVTGAMNENVKIAKLELVYKDFAESCEGQKDESSLGLVVVSKGGESEQVTKAKTVMVGGAIVDKIKGSHAIASGGSATFVGALQKLEAKSGIMLKCGESVVVIDDSGVTIKGDMITITAGKIQLPKAVTEG
jgi:type VI secretion system secreted protein VgrG